MAVRYRTTAGSDNTGTVEFSETTPLEEGYILLAFMYRNQASELPTPSGWTKIGENSIVSGRRVAAYVRRSNGSVNSFVGSGSSGTWRCTLLAYESAETNTHQSGLMAAASTTSSVTSMTATSSVSTSMYGVTVAHLSTGGATSNRNWGAGFSEAHQSSSIVAIAERISTPSTFTPSVSWSGSVSNNQLTAVHIPLAVPALEDTVDYFTLDEEGGLVPLELLGVEG